MLRIFRSIPLLCCLTSVACGPPDPPGEGETGGTVVVSTGADADAIFFPIVITTIGRIIADQIYEPLADISDSLNIIGDGGFTPRLAKSWTWSADSSSVTFALDPRARWHDGRPVRSQDVKFSHGFYVDPAIRSIGASALSNVDSIATPDSLTAVVFFKRRSPEQFFEFVYNLRVLPEHRLATVARDKIAESSEATNPVGSGPFRFVRWARGEAIEVEADTNAWLRRPLLDRIIVSVAPDANASITRVLAGEADFIEVLRGDAVERIKNNPNAIAMNYPSYDYGALHWNLRKPDETRGHPILGEPALRRALAMGIDRAATVRSILDTLGVVNQGPYVRAQSFVDPTLVAFTYDQSAARALLDSLGWKDTNADSVRDKNGRPLELTLLVPTSSGTRMRMSVILQDQFKQLGVRLKLDQLESNVFNERLFATRDWDGALVGWHPDPGSSGVAQTWASRSARPDGGNVSRYMSAAFDAHLDSAQTSVDPAARKTHFRQAFLELNADAPAIWLYELRSAVGINKRIRPGVLRPDAWWSNLDKWSIPADQRIARDRVGLSRTADAKGVE
ncbi:MAG: peptide ABC transporter substrate-binding protein [Gemmatimonadaceae bacterium]